MNTDCCASKGPYSFLYPMASAPRPQETSRLRRRRRHGGQHHNHHLHDDHQVHHVSHKEHHHDAHDGHHHDAHDGHHHDAHDGHRHVHHRRHSHGHVHAHGAHDHGDIEMEHKEISYVSEKKIDYDIESSSVEALSLSIHGMTCSSCEKKAFRTLQKTSGVTNVSVNFLFGKGSVDFYPHLTSAKVICAELQRQTGFKASVLRTNETEFYFLSTRECDGEGVQKISDSLWKVNYDPVAINVRDKVTALGLRVEDIVPNTESQDDISDWKLFGITIDLETRNQFVQFAMALIATIPILVLSWGTFSESTDLSRAIAMLVLATVIQVVCARKIYMSVYFTIRHGFALDSDCLVALSTSVAYLYSVIVFILHRVGQMEDEKELYESSSLLLTLVLFGKVITAMIRRTAADQVKFDVYQPTTMHLEAYSDLSSVPASLITYGDRIILQPGEQAVTDGIVVSGSGEFDESHVTGESLPVLKKRGKEVLAGAQLVSGNPVVFRATRLVPENSVSNLKVLVNSVSSFRTKQSDIVEAIAKYLTPVMVVISCGVFLIWALVDSQGTRQWSGSKSTSDAITYAIATLAVSCPCALVLVIPLVLSIGVAVGKKSYGVLLKTAEPTEIARHIKHVVFDKTGTLTMDTLGVKSAWINETTLYPVRGLIRSVVAENKHPISRAVAAYMVDYESEKDSEKYEYPVGEIENVVGSGVKTTFKNPVSGKSKILLCGKPAFVGASSSDDRISKLLKEGSSLFCVAVEKGPILAIFGIASTLQPNSARVVQTLQQRNITVHVLSGDTSAAVSAVCVELGITDFQADTSPEGKLDYITNLQTSGTGKVLFCGDGANDALALAAADIGVSMTPEGITLASADACVLTGDIAGVLRLLDLARQVRIRILIGVIWALGYNFFAILMVSGAFVKVHVGPAWAGVSEVISLVPVFLVAMSAKLAQASI